MNKTTLNLLVKWFKKERESYFFREDRTPYRVWVSEVVLQQTRIQAAIEPLKRFFGYFPDIHSLASSTEEEVVFAFRGLGYYSRARNLRKGAIYITENFSGELPQEYDELLKVPSIGPYTAAAISSICFGKRYPVCDGNVKRVLIRFMQWDLAVSDLLSHNKVIEVLMPVYQTMKLSPGESNEAIMELGQKICVRSKPKCNICPIAKNCCSFKNDVVEKYPKAKKKQEFIDVKWHLLLVAKDSKVVLQQWDDFYFLQKQISFPSILEFVKEKRYLSSWDTNITTKQDMEALLTKYKAQKLPIQKHGITKHKITVQPYHISKKWLEKTYVNPFMIEQRKCVRNKLVSSALTRVWQDFTSEGVEK